MSVVLEEEAEALLERPDGQGFLQLEEGFHADGKFHGANVFIHLNSASRILAYSNYWFMASCGPKLHILLIINNKN